MSDQESAPQPPPPRPQWGALSLAIFIIGLLILVPSGLCTGIFGAVALFGGTSVDDALSFLAEALIFGGIPILIGFVLVRVGLALRRKG